MQEKITFCGKGIPWSERCDGVDSGKGTAVEASGAFNDIGTNDIFCGHTMEDTTEEAV